jgi:transposase
MRRGFDGLAAEVAHVLQQDPYAGHLFIFRSKRGDYLKILYWDGSGLCLFAKRLEQGRFALRGLLAASLPEIGSKASWPSMATDRRRQLAIDAGAAGALDRGDRLAANGGASLAGGADSRLSGTGNTLF